MSQPDVRCRHCDHPIVPHAHTSTGWTHGAVQGSGIFQWSGVRCPGRLTGAEPAGPAGPERAPGTGSVEPENRSLVLFEYSHDMEVWFRSDETAEHARGLGASDDERWFRVGNDDEPVSWSALLEGYPDKEPALLERAS